ncbi:Wzz/FepE/Etk N-terminal domain-containing protein [Parapedobacter indicus]|uniref:Chain length determinant protein n=1 Tax=Parapedobacter indicus TaxID=1477437 RepID=A0A1I3TFW4_9SPHI|nr:Wzz/FepE/Etk N-terminal domain-containing protein [Parapedobacter indicus]PPK99552.1 subunit length determinant protein [Parapedobacter indicus]SFJ68367.1 Chain length determinant protein [Parapedobacter indicus]
MTTEPLQPLDDGEISIKEIILDIQIWLNYLLSKWRILLIVGALGGVIGLAYAFLKQPLYTATTTFVLEGNDTRTNLGGLSGMAALAGIDLGGNAGGLFQGNNILELYKSRNMLEKTLMSRTNQSSNELLIERYIAYRNLKDDWENQPELLALDFHKAPETLDSLTRRSRDGVITSIVNAIRSEVLTVEKPDKSLSIVQVDVSSPDEVFSKAFNENLVKEVNEFYVQTKTKKSTDNIAILEQKVDSVHAVMTGAIYSAAKVSDATPNLNPTRQVQRTAPTQEAQFSAETNKAILSQLLQNLELTKMNLLQEQPLIQLVDQPVYPLKVERVGKVKGIIVGGFLFVFLTALMLILRRFYRKIMGMGIEVREA